MMASGGWGKKKPEEDIPGFVARYELDGIDLPRTVEWMHAWATGAARDNSLMGDEFVFPFEAAPSHDGVALTFKYIDLGEIVPLGTLDLRVIMRDDPASVAIDAGFIQVTRRDAAVTQPYLGEGVVLRDMVNALAEAAESGAIDVLLPGELPAAKEVAARDVAEILAEAAEAAVAAAGGSAEGAAAEKGVVPEKEALDPQVLSQPLEVQQTDEEMAEVARVAFPKRSRTDDKDAYLDYNFFDDIASSADEEEKVQPSASASRGTPVKKKKLKVDEKGATVVTDTRFKAPWQVFFDDLKKTTEERLNN